MIRIGLTATLFTLLVAQQAPAEMMQQAEVGTVSWRSTAGSEASIAEEIAALYQTLYNTGSLRVREVPNTEAKLIEPLLRQEGVFHGAHFPTVLDNVLCDLNTTICDRDRVPAKALDTATGHVGGYEISTPIWRFGKGSDLKVVIPDYQLEPFTRLRPVIVGADWTPETARIDPETDCSSWGMSCAKLVAELNPPLLGGTVKDEKEVLLPFTGYRTEIPLAASTTEAVTNKTTSRISEEFKTRGISIGNEANFAAPPAMNDDWTTRLETTPPADLLEGALKGNLVGRGVVSKYGFQDEPAFPDKMSLFALINHPFAHGQELTLPYRGAVGVAVMDSDFTPGHCDLRLADDVTTPVGSAGANAPCGRLMSAPADPTRDHAAHVIGIIGAPINHAGVVGVAPFAAIHFLDTDVEFRTVEQYEAFRDHLNKVRRGKMRVANLSWGVRLSGGDAEDLRAEIRALENLTLFVVAAGNEGQQFLPDDCPILPACLSSLGNVITVTGLNRDAENPALWSSPDGSANFGKHVDMAAIAEDVLSTVREDQIGVMSGTSMAAPQVAGAAAMIYSAIEWGYRDKITSGQGSVSPAIVKSRLIYTSDLFPPLVGLMTGGRLNVGRAIDIVPTQLSYMSSAGMRQVKGKLLKRPNDVVLCGGEGDTEVSYPWRAIRRMVYDEFTTRYRIFFNTYPDDRNSPLEQAFCTRLLSQSQTGELQAADGPVSFRIDDIRDYTSPLFDP